MFDHMSIGGFWSYVHADDDAEIGRISQLARDVVGQFELLTGDTIKLFLDRDNLEWGDEWRAKVDDSLASIAFFIPILTPRYFLSAECRRELNSFIRKAKSLGLSELLMPILYVDFPAIHAQSGEDELIDLVAPFQWEDWTELRFADLKSAEYRHAVARLAHRLVSANAAVEQPSPSLMVADSESVDDIGDDGPGTLEVLQSALVGMTAWSDTLAKIGNEIAVVGEVMAAGTARVESSKNNPKTEFAFRLRVLKDIADNLEKPVNEIERLSQESTAQLYDVDAGVRYTISQAPAEVESGGASIQEACEFFDRIRDLTASAEEGLGQTQGMVDSISSIETLSRDIRPVMRKLRKALTRMVEGRDVMRSWLELIDQVGLDCGKPSQK